MTPQEAIINLQYLCIGVSNLDILNAVNEANIALEKQIPKKPILDTIFPSGIKWFRCPACNHNNIENFDGYCHSCGQALDWGDSNDR